MTDDPESCSNCGYELEEDEYDLCQECSDEQDMIDEEEDEI